MAVPLDPEPPHTERVVLAGGGAIEAIDVTAIVDAELQALIFGTHNSLPDPIHLSPVEPGSQLDGLLDDGLTAKSFSLVFDRAATEADSMYLIEFSWDVGYKLTAMTPMSAEPNPILPAGSAAVLSANHRVLFVYGNDPGKDSFRYYDLNSGTSGSADLGVVPENSVIAATYDPSSGFHHILFEDSGEVRLAVFHNTSIAVGQPAVVIWSVPHTGQDLPIRLDALGSLVWYTVVDDDNRFALCRFDPIAGVNSKFLIPGEAADYPVVGETGLLYPTWQHFEVQGIESGLVYYQLDGSLQPEAVGCSGL